MMSQEQEQEIDEDQFPIGMRVLVVDDDRTGLLDLEAVLLNCHYHVLSATLQVEIQITKVVMKGKLNGACDYLLKPVRVEQLKLMWQHVFKIRRRTKINVDLMTNISAATACCCASPVPLSTKRRRKQCNDLDDNKDLSKPSSSTPQKQKPQLVWSMEMSPKLQIAVKHLGNVDKAEAEPKKIVDLMNVEGLTTENVPTAIQHALHILASSYRPMLGNLMMLHSESFMR
ncbi:two-component response regulator ARR10-like [Rosa rugosa]|uniref:two-component response regulator ARR10-like n=1 Tax=Rosa rugosa TaxID=74645 RepID=UPI002B416E40|nr:two-component response regulator ARR10-like [Rosa rugosa]